MIVDAQLKTKYNLQAPYFEYIQNYLDQTLLNYTKQNFFAYSSRIKALNSISEKIESGRYSSWQELDDFVACVIIIPNLSYENEVLNFLETIFVKIDVKKKGDTFKGFDAFRFDSTRFLGNIKSETEDKTSIIHQIKFEVQIRSAFEHAWSVTTHDLAYKSETIDWRVLRLVAQLKASVEQLDMISLGATEISKKITKFKWPEIDIKIELLNFLASQFEKGIIPMELKPKDFSRVVDNLYPLISKNLSVWKPRKWIFELKAIFKLIEISLKKLNEDGFPMSLSLYQIIFGILVQEKIINDENLSKIRFFKPDAFFIIFTDLKYKKLLEFEI
jgi:ppGpp synthetase/RelA/SpoT-type nucleotidyltranferase